MKKIEIVAPGDELATIRTLLAEFSAGYTVIPNVSGRGHHGYHEGRLLFNDRASQVMVVVVVPPEEADPIIEGVLALFEEVPGVIFVTDAAVARASYFEPSR